MAKYGRFDPRNKKKKNDKYRTDRKKTVRQASDKQQQTDYGRQYNYR